MLATLMIYFMHLLRAFQQRICMEIGEMAERFRKSNKTRRNIENLFVQHSIAAAKAEIFAMKAKKEGRPHIISFFTAIAESRSVRARRVLRLLRGKVGNTEENLKEVFENDDKKDTLTQSILDAEREGMNVFEQGLKQMLMVEIRISSLKKYASSDMDVPYRVCGVCGYIHVGDEAPDNCPVCNAIKSKFKKIKI